MSNRLVIILIVIILFQSIYGSCERRKMERIMIGHLKTQEKSLKKQIDSISHNNFRYQKLSEDLLQQIADRETQTIYISQKTNEKKNRIIRTVNADSLQRIITNRYR